LDAIWTLVRRTNQYLEERQPWRLAKQSDAAPLLDTILWSAAEATRIAAILLAPYIPSTSDRIMEQLGLPSIADGAWTSEAEWGAVTLTRVQPGSALFPRIETA
jgi:methionyl-tRNA synthetase